MAGGAAIIGTIDGQLSSPGYRHHPAILSRRLQWRNALRRHPAIYPAALLVLAAFIACFSRASARELLQEAATHWLMSALVFAVLCTASVVRAKRRALQSQMHSWLAALPVSNRVLATAARVPVNALLVSLAAIAVACCAGLPPGHAGQLLLSLAAASALGLGVGWLWPHRQTTLIAPSWYTRVRRSPRALWRASSWGLGTWPVAHSQVWGRPKVTARQLAFLALGIPLGTPAIHALLLVGFALIVSHLLRLLAATARVALPAARWLAPTPVGFVGLSTALIWFALVRQLVVIGLLLVLICALPVAVMATQAALRGALWLVLSFILSVMACAQAYGSSSPDRAWGRRLRWRSHRVGAGA